MSLLLVRFLESFLWEFKLIRGVHLLERLLIEERTVYNPVHNPVEQ